MVFPEEVCPQVLRTRYPDLAGFDDDAVRAHFHAFGREEGRTAAVVAVREEFTRLFSREAKTLEIGPFCQPVFTGPNVSYLDVLDAEQLRSRGEAIGIDTSRCPKKIHYSEMKEASGTAFDLIFSSHNLEHQPDLVGHLNDAADALAPGGVYAMLIPDKRYCFDHFLPETTIADVLEAHVEQRTRHASRHIIEHMAFTTHNEPSAHWRGEHGLAPDGSDGRLLAALDHLATRQDGYTDVHAWKFTPQSFRCLMQVLAGASLSRLRALRVYDTPRDRNEFAVILGHAHAA